MDIESSLRLALQASTVEVVVVLGTIVVGGTNHGVWKTSGFVFPVAKVGGESLCCRRGGGLEEAAEGI